MALLMDTCSVLEGVTFWRRHLRCIGGCDILEEALAEFWRVWHFWRAHAVLWWGMAFWRGACNVLEGRGILEGACSVLEGVAYWRVWHFGAFGKGSDCARLPECFQHVQDF